jgi:hypothetical protein
MTRPFYIQVNCPHCGCYHTAETAFGRWIRNNKALDSKDGYSVIDQDYHIHRYKTYAGRSFQCWMMVEIKTMARKMTYAQRDTVNLINQITRNRRQTPTKALKNQAGTTITKIYSYAAKETVILKAFGIHVLTFSRFGPDDSEIILWDGKRIDLKILTRLLRFDLDPDTLGALDLRSHHPVNAGNSNQRCLF